MFSGAKNALVLHRAFVNEVAQEIGMDHAISLEAKVTKAINAKQGKIMREQAGSQEIDAKTAYLMTSKAIEGSFGFSWDLKEESPQRIAFNVGRCPIYEACQEVGMNAESIEALCRAGYSHDERPGPAVNALLGAQRGGGGWCRGGPHGAAPCTVHALRAVGAHPELRTSPFAQRALEFMRSTRRAAKGCNTQVWKGAAVFATMQALAAFDQPIAHHLIREALESVAARQQKNGTFGQPCRTERVLAVLVPVRALSRGHGG